MIHHSLTKDGDVKDWDAIRKYHIEERGWKDIGYHFGVEQIRGIYQVQIGRNLNTIGAHCKEDHMNFKAIGICVVGNYDLAVPPAKLLGFLAQSLVVPLMRKFKITSDRIVTHHDYATYKTCPGKLFPMEDFKESCLGLI